MWRMLRGCEGRAPPKVPLPVGGASALFHREEVQGQHSLPNHVRGNPYLRQRPNVRMTSRAESAEDRGQRSREPAGSWARAQAFTLDRPSTSRQVGVLTCYSWPGSDPTQEKAVVVQWRGQVTTCVYRKHHWQVRRSRDCRFDGVGAN